MQRMQIPIALTDSHGQQEPFSCGVIEEKRGGPGRSGQTCYTRGLPLAGGAILENAQRSFALSGVRRLG